MIKRKLYAYAFVLMAVVCAACSNEYKVEGTSSATRLDGKMLFLKLFQDGEWVPVDSAEIVHGRFKMKGNADSTRLVTLYINDEPFMPFVLEDGKVVAHRNVLVFRDKSAVELGELNAQCRCLLSAYLNIQYLAWCGLCRLCREFAPLVQGNYAWQGDAIALLALFDALWCLRWVKPVQGDRSKKCYFQHLQAFFHLPVLDDPCRRLGDLGKRAEPHGFLVKLSDDYQRYWEEREG